MSAIQNILTKSGISTTNSKSKDDKSLETKLERAGLGLENVLGELADVMRNSDSEALKLKAMEHVLKMHGVMKDSGAAPQSVNIIINDGKYGSGERNPILFPREITLELETA